MIIIVTDNRHAKLLINLIIISRYIYRVCIKNIIICAAAVYKNVNRRLFFIFALYELA